MDRGLVQIYTGDGKGKTTAALGLVLRACGHGQKVFLAQIAKGREYGELEALRRFAELVTVRQYGRAEFIVGEPTPEDRRLARAGWEEVLAVCERGVQDLLILDEIGIALHFRLVDLEEVRELLRRKPQRLELVLTGRKIPSELYELADLVTEMREVKHYYARGVKAREGIEY